MIINNFNSMRVASGPLETDSPLPINPKAVLPSPVALKRLQFVTGRYAQVFQADGRIQDAQPCQGRFLNVGRQSAGKLAVPNLFCFAVAKAGDHVDGNLPDADIFVKRIYYNIFHWHAPEEPRSLSSTLVCGSGR